MEEENLHHLGWKNRLTGSLLIYVYRSPVGKDKRMFNHVPQEDPHLVIVTTRDSSNYIKALYTYSYHYCRVGFLPTYPRKVTNVISWIC